MANAKKKWMQCSRCRTKVYDVVITKHMWKSHRAYMMKNRGGRKAAPSSGKPVDLGLHAARASEKLPKPLSMLEKHRGQKVDGRTAWGRTVNYERKLEAERKREVERPVTRAEAHLMRLALEKTNPTLRATYLAAEGKTLTVTVHQGKNYVEISNVTLVEISE